MTKSIAGFSGCRTTRCGGSARPRRSERRSLWLLRRAAGLQRGELGVLLLQLGLALAQPGVGDLVLSLDVLALLLERDDLAVELDHPPAQRRGAARAGRVHQPRCEEAGAECHQEHD